MKTLVNIYEFVSWFTKHRPNNFSPLGRIALFEMMTNYEHDTGEEMEFDPIAFCCDYTEYKDMEEFWLDYDRQEYPDEKSIMDVTHYYAFGNSSFIIQNI